MKDEVFIKDYRGTDVSWDVAHLYEHIVMIRINEQLESDFGLLGGVHLSARTYHQLIEFHVDTYMPKANGVVKKIITNRLEHISDDELVGSIRSLESEEGYKFDYQLDALRKDIELLDSIDWKLLEGIEVQEYEEVDFKVAESKVRPYFKHSGRLKRRKILIDLAVPNKKKNNPPHHPLAIYVAESVLGPVSREFTMTDAGFYVYGYVNKFRNSRFLGIGQCYTDSVGILSRQEIITRAQKTIDSFKNKQELARIRHHLMGQFGERGMHRMDPVWDVFEETGYLVGKKGLKKLATPENVRDILDKLEVHVQIR